MRKEGREESKGGELWREKARGAVIQWIDVKASVFV